MNELLNAPPRSYGLLPGKRLIVNPSLGWWSTKIGEVLHREWTNDFTALLNSAEPKETSARFQRAPFNAI